MGSSSSSADAFAAGTDWLDRRAYPDLDERAERALREAGQHFSEDAVAEAWLERARAIAPSHRAVIVAYYRYHLYKHRYDAAAGYARQCVEHAASDIGLAEDPLKVSAQSLARVQPERSRRFWLFASQAYGYVLMRAGFTEAGGSVLQHLVDIDTVNESRTAELWAVIQRGPSDDD